MANAIGKDIGTIALTTLCYYLIDTTFNRYQFAFLIDFRISFHALLACFTCKIIAQTKSHVFIAFLIIQGVILFALDAAIKQRREETVCNRD